MSVSVRVMEMLKGSGLYTDLDRAQAEQRLRASNSPAFIIRRSSISDAVALSWIDNGKIEHHFVIIENDKFTYTDSGIKNTYDTIEEFATAFATKTGRTVLRDQNVALPPKTPDAPVNIVYSSLPNTPAAAPTQPARTPLSAPRPAYDTVPANVVKVTPLLTPKSWILNSHLYIHDNVSPAQAKEELSRNNSGIFSFNRQTERITLTYKDTYGAVHQNEITLDAENKPSITLPNGTKKQYENFQALARQLDFDPVVEPMRQYNFNASAKVLEGEIEKHGKYLPKASKGESLVAVADLLLTGKKNYIIRNSESMPGFQAIDYLVPNQSLNRKDWPVAHALVTYDERNSQSWSCMSKDGKEVKSFTKFTDMAIYMSLDLSGILDRSRAKVKSISSDREAAAASNEQLRPKLGNNSGSNN